MPFPSENEVFKLCICPCCFEGFSFVPFNNCFACRVQNVIECDPLGSKNCFVDQQIQQCCINVVCLIPFHTASFSSISNVIPTTEGTDKDLDRQTKGANKFSAGIGCCNSVLIPCDSFALPMMCFKTCAHPHSGDSLFPAASDVCCKTHCYCCVSG